MKRWSIIVGCTIAVMVILFYHTEQVGAKARTIFKTGTIAIQKGQSYRLNVFLKTVETAYYDVGYLRSKIKKGKKITLSGRGLTIKKRTFKAKKIGDYKLKVKTKKKCYVFPLHVVEKIYKLNPNEIARITIETRVMGQRTEIELENMETINQIVKKINQVKYSFVFPKTLKRPCGFGGHYVNLYAGDGSLLKSLAMGNDGFSDGRIKWQSNSYLAQDCYDYIVKVYNDGLLGSEGQSQ